MKKTTTLIMSALLLTGFNSQLCLADYADIKNEKPKSIARVWGGINFADDSDSLNSGASELNNYNDTGVANRKGTKKASEFYSLDNSPAFGFFYKANILPQRLHLEMDVANDDEWFGDFRYSYKDYVQARFLPRRLYHNLDNIRMFAYDGNYDNPDFTGLLTNYGIGYDAGSRIQIKDLDIDDYGLRIDIDQFRLRFKTPNFPLHAYTSGEIVKRQGKQQLRFMGGNAYHSGAPNGPMRVSESRDIDQQNKEYSIGTNAHLGPLEIDISHTQRKFENDKAAPLNYYDLNGIRATDGYFYHNVIPTLKADTNTFKIHTSHTGRIVASATLSELSKSNEYSGARATNTMSYGEISWLPREKLSFAAKLRYQRNRASKPSTGTVFGTSNNYNDNDVDPGMETDYTMAFLAVRYVPVPKLNLKAQYTKHIKDVSESSSINYRRPLETIKDTYTLNANWRAMPKVKVKGKLNYRGIRTDFGDPSSRVVNINPEKTTQGVIGVTWTPRPGVAAFFTADVAKEKTDDNRQYDIADDDLSGEMFNQRYLASLTFQVNEKFSVSPAYSFMSKKQEQDIVWEDTTEHIVDRDYESEQKAHNLALSFRYVPTPKLDLNATVDYTSAKGTYVPIQGPIDFVALAGGAQNNVTLSQIGLNAYTETEELNIHLEGDYDLGNGWGTGVELRYTDWSDDSFDNPSDGTFVGGLMKITKELSL